MRFSERFNCIVDFGGTATYGVVPPKSILCVTLLVPFEFLQHMASLFSSRTVFTCVLGAHWSRLIETVPLSAYNMFSLRKSYFETLI